MVHFPLQDCLRQAKGVETLVGSQLDFLTVFEEKYQSLVKLLEDCPPSLIVDKEMPADEALKQHKRFFNQDLPEAVKSLQDTAAQITQPDSQTQLKLKEVNS